MVEPGRTRRLIRSRSWREILLTPSESSASLSRSSSETRTRRASSLLSDVSDDIAHDLGVANASIACFRRSHSCGVESLELAVRLDQRREAHEDGCDLVAGEGAPHLVIGELGVD